EIHHPINYSLPLHDALPILLKTTYGLSNVSRYFDLPKDPKIHVVPASMGDYVNISIAITKLLLKYVPQEAIHVYSIDETWITVNGLEKSFGTRRQIAELIQQDIFNTFGLTCSIGIGDNKFLAKVVMDLYAKKESIAECRYEDVETKLWPFPVEKYGALDVGCNIISIVWVS